MARPTKLTPELQQSIIERLRAGSTIRATCDSVGIGESTFHQWQSVGDAYNNGLEHDKMPRRVADREALAEFAEAVSRAQADGMIRAAVRFRAGMEPSEAVSETTETVSETRLNKDGKPYEYRRTVVKRTVTTSPGDWRAAMEYLARRDPDNWAKLAPQRLEHTGADGGPIKLYGNWNPDDWD